MKRKTILIALLLALLVTGQALAEISCQGRVISSESAVITAPFGGIIDKVLVRAGDTIHVGDPVASLQTT